MNWEVRLAIAEDIPALDALIARSVRGLSTVHYSSAQMDAALGSAFGVDRQLIIDGTYFVVEAKDRLIGGGGWSKRQTLFGSHHHHAVRNDAELDPATEAARVRAFFVDPAYARRGIGRAILKRCEEAIAAAGFSRIELASTLPGVPFYQRCGYAAGPRQEAELPNGLTLGIVPMKKLL